MHMRRPEHLQAGDRIWLLGRPLTVKALQELAGMRRDLEKLDREITQLFNPKGKRGDNSRQQEGPAED